MLSRTTLAAFAITTTCLASCGSEQTPEGAGGYHVIPEGSEEGFRALPPPAKGPIVAVQVTENGDIVCTKSDGGSWSSANGGHVEFYVRPEGGNWELADIQDYAPQPEDGIGTLEEVVSPQSALHLLDGQNHSAQCIAVPYIDIEIAPPWESCPSGDEELACTRSGVYTFSVSVDAGKLLPEDATGSCGKGNGHANGNVLCVGMNDRPAGLYPYTFECDLGGSYEVTLNTIHGEAYLSVTDGERTYGFVDGVSSKEFSVSSMLGVCVAFVVAEQDSKFSLKVKETRPGSELPVFDDLETMIRAAKPGDILAVRHSDSECDWMGAEKALFPYFCHSGIVTSSWPNFRTVEAINFEYGVKELDRYDYWTKGEGISGARVVLLRVPGGDADAAVTAAQGFAADQLPYKVFTGGGLFNHTSFYCSKLVHGAYYVAGTDIRGGDTGLFYPDDLVYSEAVEWVGYYESP